GGLIRRAAARRTAPETHTPRPRLVDRALPPVAMIAAALGVIALLRFVVADVGFAELGRAALLGVATAARVLLLTALAAVVWVPIGIAVGMRPGLARAVQPVAQFLAAFPANVLFPIFVVAMLRWRLDPDIWLSPLIVLGTQWYILFNVIAGAAALPAEMVL